MPRASDRDVSSACPANQTPVLKPQHTADRKSLKAQHNIDRNQTPVLKPSVRKWTRTISDTITTPMDPHR